MISVERHGGRIYDGRMSTKTRGYTFAFLAIVIFSLQDAISKHLGGAYPPIFITMIRFWAFAAFAVVMARRGAGSLRQAAATKWPLLQWLRGVLLATQIVLVITSFKLVGLAHSQAIFSAGPIMVALLSMPLLGERVGWRRWSAITIGLIGVLVILKPEGEGFDLGVVVPLAAALTFALYVIATRYVSRDDSAMTSFLYTGISSHYFLIRAYDVLDAAAVQPIMYLQLVFASVLGTTIFGETLGVNVVLGSVIVVAAGIFTIWRESVIARRLAKKTMAENVTA